MKNNVLCRVGLRELDDIIHLRETMVDMISEWLENRNVYVPSSLEYLYLLSRQLLYLRIVVLGSRNCLILKTRGVGVAFLRC